jgi:anti-anti-sigma factor
MTIQTELRFGTRIALIRANGSITLGDGVWELRACFLELMQQGYVRIVLNLAQVRYTDPSAIGAILAAMKGCRAKKGQVVLVGMSDYLRDIFEACRGRRRYQSFETEAAAVTHLATML